MEARMKKYSREVSPERAKVWTEKSPKYHQKVKKVPIVYYLSKNRQLEHPHFMEVLMSSPNGLYLRDVIERLNVLRGRGMASMYSWSSKRSYRNGFVWHDLSEDDLILPAHGNEYVLKGSELFDESNSDQFSPIVNTASQNMKQIVVEPPSSRSNDDSSSSSSMNNGKGNNKHCQEDDELSPPALRSVSSGVSPDSRDAKNSSSWCLAEYKVYKSEGLADASTQTDETVSGCGKKPIETFSRGVSTDDDGSSEPETSENNLASEASCAAGKEMESAEISRNSVSPPFSNSASSLGAKTDTLESLIRADVSKMNSFRILEQEDVRMPAHSRLRASNMLMQLISCGSISVKDNNFGLVPTYKPKFGHSKFQSPFFSSSFMMGDFDRLSETPSLMGLRLEEKEYFSGSLVETKLQKKDAVDCNASLKRSSSYNGDRASNQMGVAENGDSKPGGSKYNLGSRKASSLFSKQQPRSESMRSPVSEKKRTSSEDTTKNIPCPTKTHEVCSKRITESSRKPDSFREDDEKVIKIDERLASGARVRIESKVPSDEP
ncbi:PREDICTED: protein UPSTREAM OF FLC-like [Camelina sativa]|uniref:Protein UPSTREAM OF FLC-like n=1 Tax=Camelina sativa TaxID=90675 RepID=A0ABM0Z5F5_CAMSA|nr:PREDICTED: protein UPSTREAM OF FLC-like [Camelina sativa]